MTVIMKVDLAGPKSRGLAIGLNEFAGYIAVGVTAFLTGYLASRYGLRPTPIYLGIGYAVLGTLLSSILVRDTRRQVQLEAAAHSQQSFPISFREVFALTSFRDRNLFAASQAGLINNLNDGMSWGIFPLFFASFGLGVERIGILKAIYPTTWGILQIATGPLSDRWGRKGLIVAGMWVQAAGLFITAATRQFEWWLVGSLLLGLGTAMVYPSLIAAVSDASHPTWRARSLSVYRFWRILGTPSGRFPAELHRGQVRASFGDCFDCGADLPLGSSRCRLDAQPTVGGVLMGDLVVATKTTVTTMLVLKGIIASGGLILLCGWMLRDLLTQIWKRARRGRSWLHGQCNRVRRRPISKPLEHQRRLRSLTATRPSCAAPPAWRSSKGRGPSSPGRCLRLGGVRLNARAWRF